MTRLATIDRLIDETFMPKRCRRSRGACQCGHVSTVHRYTGTPHQRGHCGVKGCDCRRFVPYDYVRERAALRIKVRRFAFRVLRECAALPVTRVHLEN